MVNFVKCRNQQILARTHNGSGFDQEAAMLAWSLATGLTDHRDETHSSRTCGKSFALESHLTATYAAIITKQ